MEALSTVEHFWNTYLSTLPEDHAHRYLTLPEAWSFGNDPEMADDLGGLVMQGKKTATCSRYLGENILDSATISVLLNGQEQPWGVVETFEITVKRYCDVTAEWAAAEGEGDLSLEHWQNEHWAFFSRGALEDGYEVSTEMLLLCERFRVLYHASP
jgi:uncharacterized protein YhfF